MVKLGTGLHDIYAAGLRIRPGFAANAALAWPSGDRGAPDVRFGAAPRDWGLDGAVFDHGVVLFARDGTACVQFGDVGRFLVTAAEVGYDLDVAADAPVLTPVLFGNLVAILSWRARRLPLHAAVVAIEGSAVILAGPAHVGKSVVAAALVRRGHVLLADEVAVVTGGACLPVGGPLQLAADALAAAGIPSAGLPRYATWNPPKHHWIGATPPEPRPYPISALFRLHKAPAEASAELVPLAGDEAVEAILHQTYWRDMLDLLDSRAWAEAEAKRVAAASIWQLAVPRDLARVEDLADLIEATVAGPDR